MTKIINAKSQIGKTEKSESEMMFNIINRSASSYDLYLKNNYVGNFYFNNGVNEWIFVAHLSFYSCCHRYIADKLDELNGVELPEFLKDQA